MLSWQEERRRQFTPIIVCRTTQTTSESISTTASTTCFSSGNQPQAGRPPATGVQISFRGSLNGNETGVRQLIRSQPLESRIIERHGLRITIPTEAEILRIKSALILKRNTTRDSLDFAALAGRMSGSDIIAAFRRFDQLYPQTNEQSALQQLLAHLASAQSSDRDQAKPATYRNLAPELADRCRVQEAFADIGQVIFDGLCAPPSAAPDSDPTSGNS